MTIKQQGGIFGRNPTYNDVTIDDGLSLGDNVKAKFGNNDLQIYHDGDHSYIEDVGQGNLKIRATEYILLQGYSTGENMISARENAGVTLYHNNINKFETTENGCNIRGNLTFSIAGNGIDFSATSGTGTSELFDDYEEGSWNMVLSSASGSFTTATLDPNATAFYTKIGRHVFIQGYFMTDAITAGTASGDIYISLPFTVANLTGYGDGGTGSIGYAASWGGDVPFSVAPRGGDSKMNIHYRTSANGNVSNMQVGDLATGSNSNVMTFTAMYIAA